MTFPIWSFTLLEATYRERTGIPFEAMDYISFGLADADGRLTNAGRLMADQRAVYNSRLFCTRWNGLEAASFTVVLRNVNHAADSTESSTNSKENSKENSSNISPLAQKQNFSSNNDKEIDKEKSPDLRDGILRILSERPECSVRQMAGELGLSDAQVRYRLNMLRKSNAIRREGSTKKGVWIVIRKD